MSEVDLTVAFIVVGTLGMLIGMACGGLHRGPILEAWQAVFLGALVLLAWRFA